MRRMTPLTLALALLATAYGSARVAAADWLPGDTFVGKIGGFEVVAPDGTVKETVDIATRAGSTGSCSGSAVRAIALNPSTTPPSLWVACAGGTNPVLAVFDATPASAHAVIAKWTVNGPWLDLAVRGSTTFVLAAAIGFGDFVGEFASPTTFPNEFIAPGVSRLAVGPDGALYTTPQAALAAEGQLISRWTLPSLRSSAVPSALPAGDEEAPQAPTSASMISLLALPGANGTTAQRVGVMQTLVPTPFGAIFPAGAFARHLETSTDGQQLLLTGDNLHDGAEQCVVAQPLTVADQTTLSCAAGSNLWSVATGLPGQPGFFANTEAGDLFRFAGPGSSAEGVWATSDAETTQTGLEVSGVVGNPAPEPVCPESSFIGPSTSGSAAWWGPYRPGTDGGVDPALSPVSWIDRCAKEVELCQAQQTTSDPAPACVCQAWSCLNPPVGEAPATPPVCKSALPALRRFYCGLARTVSCTAFPNLPPLPASCDSQPEAAAGGRRKRLRRSLQATA